MGLKRVPCWEVCWGKKVPADENGGSLTIHRDNMLKGLPLVRKQGTGRPRNESLSGQKTLH